MNAYFGRIQDFFQERVWIGVELLRSVPYDAATMELRPFKLERYFARYEFDTKYLLSSSDCESWSVDEILQLEKGAADGFNRYA